VAWDLEHFAQFARLVREASAGKGDLAPMTLCTGRPQPYVEAMMKLLDIRYPVICENGAVLYDLASNEATYAPGVTHEKIAQLRALRCYIEDELLTHYDGAVIQFGKEAQLSVFCKHPEIFGRMGQQVAEFVAKHGPEVVINTSHFYLNISLAKLDKGTAIAHILNQVGLKRDEVAGIGDTVGDMPLRDAVGFFACPSNAVPQIKEVADYVSPYPMIVGVLDILKHPRLRLR
jgi:hydroxymethylpyrimidine pyrophosphatase-like HAD family hydrolase